MTYQHPSPEDRRTVNLAAFRRDKDAQRSRYNTLNVRGLAIRATPESVAAMEEGAVRVPRHVVQAIVDALEKAEVAGRDTCGPGPDTHHFPRYPGPCVCRYAHMDKTGTKVSYADAPGEAVWRARAREHGHPGEVCWYRREWPDTDLACRLDKRTTSTQGPAADLPTQEHDQPAFVNKFAVALLEAPSHRHNGGATYIKYDDAVRIAHQVDARRAVEPRTAQAPTRYLACLTAIHPHPLEHDAHKWWSDAAQRHYTCQGFRRTK